MASRLRWAWVFLVGAACLGGAGVTLAAAGAHIGGGEPIRAAADIMMIHAAVVVAIVSIVLGEGEGSGLLLVPAGLFVIGGVAFGGAISLIGFFGSRPVPQAAPFGGLCLIAGWITLMGLALWKATRRTGWR